MLTFKSNILTDWNATEMCANTDQYQPFIPFHTLKMFIFWAKY